MPEPAVPRPRSRAKAAEPVSLAAPQSALATVSEVERRMLAAIEDLHAGARLLGMPPQALTIGDRNGVRSSIDPDAITTVERVNQHLADMEDSALGPQPVSLAAIAAPTNPDAYLVGNFIRPGTTVMMAGPPGSSKSWASRQLALSCAAGLHHFLDHYAVSRPLNVLIVDEDNGPDEEWRREETLLGALQLQRSQVARAHRTSLAGVSLDQPAWQSWLRGLILRLELDLVILDPISEMYTSKELREEPSFRSVIAFLKRLKLDFPRLATLLVHHTRKQMAGKRGSQTSDVDEVRGQWAQTPDVVAVMSRLPERRVAWELHKRVPHSKLLLEATEAGPLRYLTDEAVQRSARMVNDDKVLMAIRGGMSSHSEIVQGTGMAKGTVSGVLTRLVAEGLLERDGDTYMDAERE